MAVSCRTWVATPQWSWPRPTTTGRRCACCKPTSTGAQAAAADSGHDVVRIADALRRSPHIRSVAPAEPGDDTVWFIDATGVGYALSPTAVEPLPDGAQDEAYAWDPVAAAIGCHLDFVSAVSRST